MLIGKQEDVAAAVLKTVASQACGPGDPRLETGGLLGAKKALTAGA